MNNGLELGTVVKINMGTLSDYHPPITEAHINTEGRIVGYSSGGTYQVLFFPEEGPLWFRREELVVIRGGSHILKGR